MFLYQSRVHPVKANNLADETPAKPTDTNTVAEIKAWLDAHNVSYPSNSVKADLLALVNDTDA
ncbi:HeH/LEM domain-containing protein [Leuconostoc pseudomesenteroides]|uniref:HeH/LEM domain-containing protein n=1 Tax=Leuconostoc pseudomesenteroides TaxID=33968 RepID=UPI0039EA9631